MLTTAAFSKALKLLRFTIYDLHGKDGPKFETVNLIIAHLGGQIKEKSAATPKRLEDLRGPLEDLLRRARHTGNPLQELYTFIQRCCPVLPSGSLETQTLQRDDDLQPSSGRVHHLRCYTPSHICSFTAAVAPVLCVTTANVKAFGNAAHMHKKPCTSCSYQQKGLR